MKDRNVNQKKGIQKYVALAGLVGLWRVVRIVLGCPNRLKKNIQHLKNEELRKHTTKMHKILYKCPSCQKEMQMNSYRRWVWCEACGSRWIFWKNRRVLPFGTKGPFRTRDEWKNWERECVREEIQSGRYRFTDTVRVKIQTSAGDQLDWGFGTLTHTPEYMLLECRYKNEDYTLIRSGRTMESLPFELGKEGKSDCVELSSGPETFLCYLSRKNAAVKLALAVEEIYLEKNAS